MKKTSLILSLFITLCYSCDSNIIESDIELVEKSIENSKQFVNEVSIDSYIYQEDSLYKVLVDRYEASKAKGSTTKSLSPEDEAFFSPEYETTEVALADKGLVSIYPGSILEGNTIIDQTFKPIIVSNRNPITVSTNLTYNIPNPVISKVLNNPNKAEFSAFINSAVKGGNFAQNERFMFQCKQFSFYDELKTAFGSNINTRKMFSSRSETTTSESNMIVGQTGLFVKFFQASFTVSVDIAPLSNNPIKGTSGYNPVYVNSITYGRMGILVIETNYNYQFAQKCIEKEFNRLFYNKTEYLTEEEVKFYNSTDFKVFIIGADSDYSVQTIKGYSQFLNLIQKSTFSEGKPGVPILCSFGDANTHQLVKMKFKYNASIEPLFVSFSRENNSYNSSYDNTYTQSSDDRYLNFYKDRQKKIAAYPYTNIPFYITQNTETINYSPDYNRWPLIKMDSKSEKKDITIRNVGLKSRIYVGTDRYSYESSGPMPGGSKFEPVYMWDAIEYRNNYYLSDSPFFITVY